VALLLALAPGPAWGEPPSPARPARAPRAASVLSARDVVVTDYADVTVHHQRGELSVEEVRRGRHPHPTRERRYAGRYRIEVLLDGKAVEAMQFEFPLMSGFTIDATQEAREANERVERGVIASVTVRVPLPPGFDQPAAPAATTTARDGGAPANGRRGSLVLEAPGGVRFALDLEGRALRRLGPAGDAVSSGRRP
jgi:hypothetical protein